ncbi:MAG TPA: hypothetical protein VI160_03550 [Gemmatimonadales bacterium]
MNPWRVLAAGLVLAGPASAQTVGDIVSRYLAARGGLERLKAVRTARLAGRISFSTGASGVDTVELARPLHVRTTLRINGQTLVQAYDGRVAWTLNPFAGDTAAHPVDPGTAKNIIAGADIDGPFVDFAAKGNAITYAGRDTAAGRPVFRLHVTRADSIDDTYFIDTASYLLLKWEGRRAPDGVPVVFETFFRDYRSVGGVQIAYRLDSDTQGRPGGIHIAFDSVRINVPVDPARFALPAYSRNR